MKVLHLLQSNCFSGAENVICQIIGMMRNEPNMEFVYCSRDGQISEALSERNINFVPIKKLSIKEVKRVIKEQKPDLIHAHDRTACVVAALATKKIPIVAHIHINNSKGLTPLLKNVVFTIFSNRYRHIFWVSDSAYDEFQFKKVLEQKSSVLYNVIDIKALNDRANSDNSTYNYEIAYVGRLSFQKNPERLMKVLYGVLQKKKDIKIAIVGSGDYEKYVVDYIRDNHLEKNIDYLGYSKNPLKIIKSSKVLIMTSRFEGTPMVALEAQCLGVPIVSTPVDGMRKVVLNGQTGYLSDNDDELTNHLIEIVSSKDLRKILSDNSIVKASDYNNEEKYCAAIKAAYYTK